MKIFVTGGTGYIGSHTVVELQQNGYDVVIVDNLCNSNIGVLDGIEKITGIRPEFEQIDLTEGEQVRDFFRRHQDIKAVIHFAALKAVGESVQKPLEYYRNNLNSLMNVIAGMREFGVKNLVFSSSCMDKPMFCRLPNKHPVNKPNRLMEIQKRCVKILCGTLRK